MSQTISKESSFDGLYRTHHRTVLAYCARRANLSDAWDAAAETFLVAWRRLESVPRLNMEAERAWLLGVAYRVLSNQRRSGRRRAALAERVEREPVPTEASLDAAVIRTEEAQEVLEALTRVSSIDREVVQLTIWEELTPSQIAEVLGISRQAVDQRYSRAKRRIARALRGQEALSARVAGRGEA